MSKWYECKVKYLKVNADGTQKTTSEQYLVDALSFTEAEANITKELESYASLGEFSVVSIKTARYAEIIPNESGDRWFKCKAVFVSLDEEKGVERRSASTMLVQANNAKEAYENLEKAFEGTISDFEIPSVQESPILDIFGILHNFDAEQPSDN